ncbi:MAG: hypothetical protein ACYDAY_10250 [Candidatus Dormibacteria bacterium]
MAEAVVHLQGREVFHVSGEQAVELFKRLREASDVAKMKPFIVDIGQDRKRWVNPNSIAYIDFRP